MTKTIKIITGLVIGLVSLWGGAYLMDIAGMHNWYSFPLAVTMFICGITGVVIFVNGLTTK